MIFLITDGGKKWHSGTVAPTAGTHAVGDRLYNSAPTLLKNISHWTCITAGTPGTWRAVGIGQGTTANRPTLVANDAGYQYLDTTIAANGSLVTWTGTIWVNAAGTSV